jgi:hypothetical protein
MTIRKRYHLEHFFTMFSYLCVHSPISYMKFTGYLHAEPPHIDPIGTTWGDVLGEDDYLTKHCLHIEIDTSIHLQ